MDPSSLINNELLAFRIQTHIVSRNLTLFSVSSLLHFMGLLAFIRPRVFLFSYIICVDYSQEYSSYNLINVLINGGHILHHLMGA